MHDNVNIYLAMLMSEPLVDLIVTFRICHTNVKVSCICVVSETNSIRI